MAISSFRWWKLSVKCFVLGKWTRLFQTVVFSKELLTSHDGTGECQTVGLLVEAVHNWLPCRWWWWHTATHIIHLPAMLVSFHLFYNWILHREEVPNSCAVPFATIKPSFICASQVGTYVFLLCWQRTVQCHSHYMPSPTFHFVPSLLWFNLHFKFLSFDVLYPLLLWNVAHMCQTSWDFIFIRCCCRWWHTAMHIIHPATFHLLPFLLQFNLHLKKVPFCLSFSFLPLNHCSCVLVKLGLSFFYMLSMVSALSFALCIHQCIVSFCLF
jgi:hypothetical protein